ncbi:MAG TPA: hypothetical protein VFU28_23110 [Vicinamibacterales bacterium]|nr:hypothetical protein [Vicinamibacterales bacterium]
MARLALWIVADAKKTGQNDSFVGYTRAERIEHVRVELTNCRGAPRLISTN